MPLPKWTTLMRILLAGAAFVCVGAVAYEAGAEGIGKRTETIVSDAVKQVRHVEPITVRKIEWTAEERFDPDANGTTTSEAWRRLDVEGELFGARAALFIGANDVAARDLHKAADLLNKCQEQGVHDAADKLNAVADQLEKGKATDEDIARAIQGAFDAMKGEAR